MLKIEDLTVEVNGKNLLHDVNLEVKKGYTNVLFGPNGAGKSALMRTIMGFSEYRVVKGRILFNGEDITGLSVDERARLGLGIMMQRPPDMSGIKLRDLVKVLSKGQRDPEALAENLDMKRFLDRDVNVGFSGGEIKRSELLQLAVQNPSLYLLDEPESGVDLVSIEQVGMTIKGLLEEGLDCPGESCKKGKSALIITHTGQILDYVKADRGFILCNGTIMCSGNPLKMLEEIKSRGYEECIKCRLIK
ncbi:MAG: ABC transporter ATP-binding protein [Syntrophomonas sp.]|jgi:Fe-S cluster assembly ATP-binding protein|nr:ABC transporter ATP-binding protein [Methanosarcina sp.]MDD3879355.1 ABC transporter ATP-binding protein [Syntrophomonas sp.]MDD4523470.1 ABC transporter ATP-binding protein [Methanosarcina sp.]HHV23801.1 ABC transporter ATP-binding protein [Methanosarcina sp.]